MIETDKVKNVVNDVKVASLIYVLKKKNIEADLKQIKKVLAEENTLKATLSKISSESDTKQTKGPSQKWYQKFIRFFTLKPLT